MIDQAAAAHITDADRARWARDRHRQEAAWFARTVDPEPHEPEDYDDPIEWIQ